MEHCAALCNHSLVARSQLDEAGGPLMYQQARSGCTAEESVKISEFACPSGLARMTDTPSRKRGTKKADKSIITHTERGWATFESVHRSRVIFSQIT